MNMIEPKLKRLHSPDIFDLSAPQLCEDSPYCVFVQAMFGPNGSDGEESFDILVCNDLWVSQQCRIGAFSGRHHLIVCRFDINEIREFLEQIALKCADVDWNRVALKLGRYGQWEFEDYINVL